MFINISDNDLININRVEAVRKSIQDKTDLILEFIEGTRRISFNSVDSRDNAFDLIKSNIDCIDLEQVVKKDR